MLFVNASDYLPTSEAVGIRLTIHDKEDFPFPDTFGYSAPTGYISSFGMRMVIWPVLLYSCPSIFVEENEQITSTIRGLCGGRRDIKLHLQRLRLFNGSMSKTKANQRHLPNYTKVMSVPFRSLHNFRVAIVLVFKNLSSIDVDAVIQGFRRSGVSDHVKCSIRPIESALKSTLMKSEKFMDLSSAGTIRFWNSDRFSEFQLPATLQPNNLHHFLLRSYLAFPSTKYLFGSLWKGSWRV